MSRNAIRGRQNLHTRGDIELCVKGFHFCRKLVDIHTQYNFAFSRLWEIDVPDDAVVMHHLEKSVTNKFTLVRELTFFEVMQLCNFERDGTPLKELNTNLGFFNCGNDNYGNSNYGNGNHGNSNYGNDNYSKHKQHTNTQTHNET